MRRLLTVVAAGILAVAATAALAQGEFTLKYVDAPDGDPLISRGMTYWGGTPVNAADFKCALMVRTGPGGKPAIQEFGPQSLPKGLSANAYSFMLYTGGWQTWAVLDMASPPKLYVDTAGTGNLSAAEPLPGSGPPEEPGFGPVAVPAAGPDGDMTTVRVRLRARDGGRLLGASVAGYMAGTVNLGGQTCRAALVDHGLTGRYDAVADVSNPGRSEYAATALAIDLDGDGRFDDSLGSSECMPLLPGLRAKEAYYSVKVKPDGSSIRLEKIEPKFGTLDIGCPNAAVILLSDLGVLRLSGTEGKWQAPACRYRAVDIQVTRTDAAGAAWKLGDTGALGSLGRFEVRAGETLALKAGPPLEGKVEVKVVRYGDDVDGPEAHKSALIGFVLVGRAGEQYAPGILKGNSRLPPPKLRILDEAGKVLTAAQFEYG